MTEVKPEVVISHVLERIEMRSNSYAYVFETDLADGADSDTRRHRLTPEVQYGGRQTVSASI
jgi:hypothetical protein